MFEDEEEASLELALRGTGNFSDTQSRQVLQFGTVSFLLSSLKLN